VASYDEVIPPGQVGYVNATLDTHKLRGTVGRGITVYTDDPRRESVMLPIRGEVVGGASVLPQESLFLSTHGRGEVPGMLLVQREPSEKGTLELTNIQVSAPWIEVHAIPLTELRPASDGIPTGRPGDWVLQVELLDSAPYGRFSESVRFETGLERQEAIEIPITVAVQPPVRLSLTELELPSTPGDSRGTILLTVRRDLDPRALKVESDTGELSLEVEPSGPRGYKVHAAWNGQGPPHGTITFKVGGESFSIPVVAAPRPS